MPDLVKRARAALGPPWVLWLTIAAIALGASLRLYQFFSDPSLWLDELAIANNLADRSFAALFTQPLSYAQVAPPGFLLVEKVVYEIFGASDRALQVYSLVAGIAALGAAALLGVRLKLAIGAWIPPLLLALSPALIFQSAQVKPYSGDVFITLGLVALALRLGENATRRGGALALGLLAPWFSFPAAVTLAGVGAALLLSAQRRRLAGVVALWGVSTVLALWYADGLVHPETRETMRAYWSSNALGFPPSFVGLVPWSVNQFGELLWSGIGLRAVKVWLGVALVGYVLLWRRSRLTLGLLALPIVVALLAAALRRYPMGDRTSHWIAALLVFPIAVAVTEAVRALHRLRVAWLAPGPALLVVAPVAVGLAQYRPPYYVDHVKPVLAAIARARQPNDALFVFPGAWHAWRWYGQRTGFSPDRVVLGHCMRRSLREPLRELDALRGAPRVWVLFAHVLTPPLRDLHLQYLDAIGVRRFGMSYPDPYVRQSTAVDAHLYDLSDPARLRNASPETFPVRPDLRAEQSQCFLGMVPMD